MTLKRRIDKIMVGKESRHANGLIHVDQENFSGYWLNFFSSSIWYFL
jgi:hypothetical protein